MKKQSNLGFLLEISGKEKLKLYLSAIFSVISSLLSIVPYILMYNIVLELFKNTVDYERIKSMAITVGIIVVIRMAVFLLSGVFSHIAAFTILYELRMKAINHMSRLNMGFFTGHTLGEVKKTINEDIEKLENFIAHQIPDLSAASCNSYYNYRISFVFRLETSFSFIYSYYFRNYKSNRYV